MTAHLRRTLVFTAILLSLPAATLATDATTHHDVSVLHCARLLDTAAGRMLGETTLIVDGGRIKELHAGALDIEPYRKVPVRPATRSSTSTCPTRPACPA
jgi:hypothetical protein